MVSSENIHANNIVQIEQVYLYIARQIDDRYIYILKEKEKSMYVCM